MKASTETKSIDKVKQLTNLLYSYASERDNNSTHLRNNLFETKTKLETSIKNIYINRNKYLTSMINTIRIDLDKLSLLEKEIKYISDNLLIYKDIPSEVYKLNKLIDNFTNQMNNILIQYKLILKD